MRRAHFLISGAWLLQGAAWFLPVVTGVYGGETNPISGLQAFLVASSAVWPWHHFYDKWYDFVLAALSVLTTLLFVIGTPWVVFRGTHQIRRVFAWLAAAGFFLNAHWYIRLRPNGYVSALGIGYFLWWWSFSLLAIGLFDLTRRNDAIQPAQGQAALLPR